MSAATPARPTRRRLGKGTKRGILAGVIVLLIVFVVLGTRVVSDEAAESATSDGFDAETYGPEHFPAVQEAVADEAVEAPELASAIAGDAEAAAAEHAVEASGGPVFSVTMTGTFGKGESGIYDLKVDGVPEDLAIRVQTGPAINGTELRDVTGEITFGEFTNQIDFQNAAAALNEEMKVEVLEGIDTEALEGQTATVTGAFTLINDASWLVTPVQVEVG